MKILLLGILCPFLTKAQFTQTAPEKPSIKWDQSVNWNDVSAKAKSEHKYIFVDCFTTWCVPCKKMDNEVFTNDSVAQFINAHFISVKLQIDRTASDNNLVKSWYNDANFISNKYGVRSYPTYLFFSPEGKLVHRDGSYNEPTTFLKILRQALDPKRQYYALLEGYRTGNPNYEMMPFLILKTAKRFNRPLADSMATVYFEYLRKLPEEDIYNEDILKVLQDFLPSSKSPLFPLFYPNSKKPNEVMKRAFLSRSIADAAITREIIDPAFNKISGKQEPNWDSLHNVIQKRFGKSSADRIIAKSQINWYDLYDNSKHQNINKLVVSVMKWLKCGGNDTTDFYDDGYLSIYAQYIADSISNKVWLDGAINWMKGVVRRKLIYKKYDNEKAIWVGEYIQTLMQLLYKAGYVNEAKKCLSEIRNIRNEVQRDIKMDSSTKVYNLDYIGGLYEWYSQKFKEGVTTWRTDFSGDWVLIKTKPFKNYQSDFSKRLLVIQQNDSVKIEAHGCPFYDTKKQKIKLEDFGCIQGHSGPTVLSISKEEGKDLADKTKELWSLSRDLKILHVKRQSFSGEKLVSEIHADYTRK